MNGWQKDITKDMTVEREEGAILLRLPIGWRGRSFASCAEDVLRFLLHFHGLQPDERVLYEEAEGGLWHEIKHNCGILKGFCYGYAHTYADAKKKLRAQREMQKRDQQLRTRST